MALYDIRTLIDAVAATLGAAPSVARLQSYDKISEGMQDYPTLQVYAEENTGTDWSTETDRITLDGEHSLKQYLIYADLYARQRSHIAEDMAQLYESINELEDILDTQDDCPPFGETYITSFRWSWRRVVFEYAGTDLKYVGARFSITIICGSRR